MTPDQAGQMQHAAAVLAAYCRGDAEAWNTLRENAGEFAADEQLTNGLILLAVESVLTLAETHGVSFDRMIEVVPQHAEEDLPLAGGRPPDWDAAVAAVKDLYHKRIPEVVDLDVALPSAFNLALVLVDGIARDVDQTPAEYASALATELARRQP